MKKIQWTEDELQSIKLHGETCDAVARAAMQRSGINFDDIERINEHYETHRWGSDADRRYRKAAVNKAVRRVAANPLMYAAPMQEEAAALR
jgi:chaperone required for assembly of F1-ATPase